MNDEKWMVVGVDVEMSRVSRGTWGSRSRVTYLVERNGKKTCLLYTSPSPRD